MELEQAKELVIQKELDRWRNSVAAGEARAKPRLFVLSDLRQNPAIETVRGPLEMPEGANAGTPEWCFFADDLPNANWEHPCRYLIVYSDGSIQSVNTRVPPDDTDDTIMDEVFPFALGPTGELRV